MIKHSRIAFVFVVTVMFSPSSGYTQSSSSSPHIVCEENVTKISMWPSSGDCIKVGDDIKPRLIALNPGGVSPGTVARDGGNHKYKMTINWNPSFIGKAKVSFNASICHECPDDGGGGGGGGGVNPLSVPANSRNSRSGCNCTCSQLPDYYIERKAVTKIDVDLTTDGVKKNKDWVHVLEGNQTITVVTVNWTPSALFRNHVRTITEYWEGRKRRTYNIVNGNGIPPQFQREVQKSRHDGKTGYVPREFKLVFDYYTGESCYKTDEKILSLLVVHSCYDDSFGLALQQGGKDHPTTEGGHILNYGEEYTIKITNTHDNSDPRDFTDNYTINHDGGDDLNILNNVLTVNKKGLVGKYLLSASGNCPQTNILELFVGGSDINLLKECEFTLPDDLAGYDVNNDGFKHFAATIKSQTQVVVKPGLQLGQGAELFLEVAPPQNQGPGRDKNFIETLSYNEFNQKTAHSRQYFNDLGYATQAQTVDVNNDLVFVNETLYDEYDRPVIETLSAPTREVNIIEVITDKCGTEGEQGTLKFVDFGYKEGFVLNEAGDPYNYTHFSLDKAENPDPVGKQEGSLGWYYSDQNGTSNISKLNETNVPQTGFPYSRTLFHNDGTEEVKGVAGPGDQHRAGSGHVSFSDRGAVQADDPYLIDYLRMREELELETPTLLNNRFYYTEAIDVNGRKSRNILDMDENLLMSLLYNSTDSAFSKSYNFYDHASRLVVRVTPNGVSQYEEENIDFRYIDKTRYIYNFRGELVASYEPDAGKSTFIYRKDGGIRFSQNAKQRAKGGRFSYTHYDRSGRQIESGEYIPVDTSDIIFDGQAMHDILEVTGTGGGLPDRTLANGQPNKQFKVFTHYDLPYDDVPPGFKQRFTRGAVSWSSNKNVTTVYSYDERGRVEWMLQRFNELGDKSIHYRYGEFGSVREVAYQKDKHDQFYHYYSYDKTGRLSKVFTSEIAPEYGISGTVTNPEVLTLQAAYEYYLNGLLKRIELAEDLQGIDFVYNIQGWLTSINHPNAADDPGQDGNPSGEHGKFQQDAFSLLLDYYERQLENTMPPSPQGTDPGQFHGLPRGEDVPGRQGVTTNRNAVGLE